MAPALSSTPSPSDLQGNASNELKERVIKVQTQVKLNKSGFSPEILAKCKLVSADYNVDEATGMKEAVVVNEVEVSAGEWRHWDAACNHSGNAEGLDA